jgi:hypothetical protein
VHDVDAKILYYKNMTRIEKYHNKDTYPKLVLNRMKIMWDLSRTRKNTREKAKVKGFNLTFK